MSVIRRCDLFRAVYGLAAPVDGAVLVLRDSGKADEVAKPDPCVLNGVIRSSRVGARLTVIGYGLTNPHSTLP